MLSIVVPVLNEAESLEPLYREIVEATRGLAEPVEIIFVDDGSSDGSWKAIESLAARHSSVSGIRFRRNFGKAAALTAGMRAARGELILSIDADLQDDPAEIPRMLGKLGEGYDVVNGWKAQRLDPWHKVYPSRVFNWVVSAITGLKLHDHNCGLKLFRAEVANEIRLYGELHRFIPVLAHARGFRVTELPVHHRPRRFGSSKYGAAPIRAWLFGLAHRDVSDRVRPAAAAHSGRIWPVDAGAGILRSLVPGDHLVLHALDGGRLRSDRHASAAALFDRRRPAGSAGAFAGAAGRATRGLHRKRKRHVQHPPNHLCRPLPGGYLGA